MLQGLHSAAAGMAAQQQRLDAVSNDIANVSTAGYQRQRLNFRDLAYVAEQTGQGVRAGAGAAVSAAGRSEQPGAIERTGQPLDVAIEGSGFLSVRQADGTVGLTRAGALRVDANRGLVTATGLRVEPAITLPRDVDPSDVSIAPDGRVSAGGRALGRLALRDVPAPQNLLAVGNGVFVATQASGPAGAAREARLQQGALERSNVDMGEAMVDLMDAQRSFSLASRAVQAQDQLLEIANQVKR